MTIENHISFNEGRPAQCHEFCDMVFEQLSRVEDINIKSRLERLIDEINRALLRIEAQRTGGNVLGDAVHEVIVRSDELTEEIEDLIKNASPSDRYVLGVILHYSKDIWKNYVQRLPIK